jgi:transcriptional regulator with XRE-family HTH domain
MERATMNENNKSLAKGTVPTPPISSASGSRTVRLEELGELIRAKRYVERLTLAQAAEQTGVSAATLSRWERQGGRQSTNQEQSSRTPQSPDMRTVAAIAQWLGVTLEQVMSDSPPPVPDVLEMHLRADPHLDSVSAMRLMKMFRAAYEQAVQESIKSESDADEPTA